MFDCNCLIHPFQNDPGTSQSGRIMEDLLSGAAKIDARELADLLDYFMQMSRHVNFYDTKLTVSDWQPFFRKSIPFTLASVIKTPNEEIKQNFAHYNSLFEKKPSSTGLQLHAYFIYYRFIKRINDWYLSVKDSGLPIESFLQILIKDKLQPPLKLFIGYTNAAVKWYGIKKIDFTTLDAIAWDLDIADLFAIDDSFQIDSYSKFQQINDLYKKFKTVFSPFLDSGKLICTEAEKSLESSLLPLKEEFQKKHPPHLGLLFAFLNIFRQLQNDLNGYSRKHLDFFYKDVLKIKSQDAIADKTHVIFEIQKQLEKYLLKKGLLVKDGKDLNKQQILFSLDDDIVVNKTEVADVRTLYLNNTIIPGPAEAGTNMTLLEGVYMAPDATKADGIDKDFATDIKNFYTLGNKESKYINPETKIYKPYPNARLGFILASPVLLLNEGTRTVTITLNCSLDEKICEELSRLTYPVSKNCCDESEIIIPKKEVTKYSNFLPLTDIYSKIESALKIEYYYISETLVGEAIKKGLDSKTTHILRKFLISSNENVTPKEYCYCPTETRKFDTIVGSDDFEDKIDIKSEIVRMFFKKRKPFQISFSGENDWLQPSDFNISMSNLIGDTFKLSITSIINADQPSISFYDNKKLMEDFDTNLPLVKIELDDHFKILHKYDNQENKCCLDKDLKFENDKIPLSLYHFFRNVKIEKDSRIDVQVCGVKNFIVQNDESLQDVNKPIFVFGTRPRVGASFYIGSKEIFAKNWQKVFVNAEWKDKPKDMGVHYKHYSYKATTFEDGSKEIVNSSFLTTAYVLDKGKWRANGQRRLFKPIVNEQGRTSTKPLPPDFPPVPVKSEIAAGFCKPGTASNSKDIYDYTHDVFTGLSPYKRKAELSEPLTPYNVSSQYGFLRFTLEGVSFQHDIFPFVLTRQLMAYAGLLSLDVIQMMVTKADDAKKIIEVMIIEINNINLHIGHIQSDIGNLTGNIDMLNTYLASLEGNLYSSLSNLPGNILQAKDDINDALVNVTNISNELANISSNRTEIHLEVGRILPNLTNNSAGAFNPDNAGSYGLIRLGSELWSIIQFFVENLKVDPELKDGLPSEPYTPVIKSLSLDYTATADISDINLIHLYPYSGAYKAEEIQLQPTLFPTFCDEGTLFLGLKNLVPGNNLNLLFQLAEATSDSESEKQEVQWHYLDNNMWKSLRKGFEVLDDASENLTTSGIVKLALPANMTNDNTIMPKGLHWIKASIPQNSNAVSETTGIYPQAISVSFTNDEANDKLRLSQPLAAESISKLNVSDANVKSVQQPYDSFGGKVPEIEQQFYVRVSEQLRHKGRAIQKFDYERLVLQEFPQLFKAKCINHSFALDAHLYKNDFPYAPGYVILAVIPDLNKLQAGNSFEPKVPVSIIEKIDTFIRKRASPFVRFRAMNPRYEKINFCLRINLLPGKDENYYKEQLKEDLKELLAPWAVGKYDKLTFGQCIYRSDIIRFLENTDYVDFITDFKMSKATNPEAINSDPPMSKICPDTPRSILIAGDIDICINKNGCDDWETSKDSLNEKIEKCTNPVIKIEDYCINEDEIIK